MAGEDEIIKARFFIEPKGKNSRVQHIGCRLVLTEKMIHAGFKKGSVFNMPEGTVEVAIEGPKKDIIAFHSKVQKNLVEWLTESAKDKEYLKMMLGNPGLVVTELSFSENLQVLDVGLYSHSLEMSQLEKGVDVYYELVSEIRKGKDSYTQLVEEVGRGRDSYSQLKEAIERSKDSYYELKEAIADLKEVNKSLRDEIAKGRQ